jgi:hypothetical protein
MLVTPSIEEFDHEKPRFGHVFYSATYALLEPRLTLVVEGDEGAAGFAVGTPDRERWHERLETASWPELRRRYFDPSAIPSTQWSADQRRAITITRSHTPTGCRSLSSAFASKLVSKNSGTWRWNLALLGADGPRLAAKSQSHTGGRKWRCRVRIASLPKHRPTLKFVYRNLLEAIDAQSERTG